jgi:hypothetical protein
MVDKTVTRGPDWMGEEVFVVESDFKTNKMWTVTLVLNDEINGNNFYSKHVLHKGTSPNEVKKLRNALKKQDWGNIDAAASSGLLGNGNANINTSTSILLGKLEPKIMVYRMAKALVQAHTSGKVTVGNRFDHLPVHFKVEESVAVVNEHNQTVHDNGTQIGGSFVSANNQKLRFDVDHCAGRHWV